MKDSYNTDNLVVANLEYLSNNTTTYSPISRTTNQKYIFEVINENDKIKYREIFTGFIADYKASHYFDLPYVINIIALKELIPSIDHTTSKYALLFVLNEVNKKNNKQIIVYCLMH